MAEDTTAPDGKTGDSELFISKISDGTNTYTIKDTEARSGLSNKQDTLVSGTNIKTINSTSVLGSGNFTLADQSLSNLDSTGQMTVDSANGTISNCILDIPQNIKLEFSNGTVTLKAGSIITRTGSTYSTVTTTQDVTWSSSTQANKKMYLFASNSGNAGGLYNSATLEKVGSGDTLPVDGSTYSLFFNTTDKLIYSWSDNTWSASNLAYPLAIIETDENKIIKGFAKDSNGNDMIFNGTCFVGHHAVVYPNMKALIPNGFNKDGSLKSSNITINSVRIIDLTSSFTGAEYANILYVTISSYSGQIGTLPIGNDLETKEDILSQPIQGSTRFYVKNENTVRNYNGTTEVTKFVHFKLDLNNIVTDFTIRQPIRLATTEMLDTLQDQIDTNTTAIDTKLDKVTTNSIVYGTNSSGTQSNIEYGSDAIANKLVQRNSLGDIILPSLHEPSANNMATPKFYVDNLADTQNGTISNCILEIPQNIKLTLENNVLTLKSGSECVVYGSTYQTVTRGSDLTRDFSNSGTNRTIVIMPNATLTYIGFLNLSHITSGESFPSDLPSSGQYGFYKVSEKQLYETQDGGTTWSVSGRTYPICIINIDSNGVASFAKDSNGNDMIFNGAGFIGHHAFVYPNVKGLVANGLNADGSLKSVSVSTNVLLIRELPTYTSSDRCIYYNANLGNINHQMLGADVNTIEEMTGNNWVLQYVKSENSYYQYLSGVPTKQPYLPLLLFANKGTTVTDFTICQPVRTATVEMLNNGLAQKQDTLTGAATTIISSDLTSNKALISNSSGKVAVSNVTDTELGYLSGVTSALQTQINAKQDIIPSSVYIPQPYITDNTDDNAELDYLLASDGSSAGLSGITTYCSDYIEITGDYIILHDVYAPSDTTYASYVLYNSNKTFLRAYTSDSYPNTTTIGDVILNKEINGAKYVRFQTNLTTKPTFSIVTQVTSQQFVYNIIDNYPYTNMSSYDGSFRYITDINVETGLIGYPNGDNQPPISSIPRNRSSYIEIPQNGILLTDVFVPSGTTYSAFALYDSNKNIVNAYNRAKLGYSSGSGTISKLFIPYSSSYKYVRFQHIDTTSDIIYGIPNNLWYSMPKSEGNNGNLLEYNKNGETLWTPAGLVGDKKSLSIGVFGGSFATSYYAQTAYNKWIEKLGIDYTTYAVSGTGFVQGTNNFVVQATNAGIHDIYVIWCSTNDFTHSISIGNKDDVYGTNTTIWANFKEVVRLCYSKNPNAKVVLFTSSPHLSSSQGNEEGRGDVTTYTNTLKEHVEAQKAMCAYYSLPCLDQYNNSQQNGFNYNLVTGGSGFHLTPYGYSLLVNNQIDFLSKI